MLALATLVALVTEAGLPAGALAHGPVAPVALDYQARVTQAPHGLEAKVVDGDQLMWLRVPSRETVVVLDYRGAPYLRFSPRGVEINHNSAMYYLNMSPVAATPPVRLGPRTRPSWFRVTAAHAYRWHEGRLHALASVARTPGVTFVGTWRVPVLVDGRATAISGGLWYAGAPSIVWFWPIVVLLLCVVAAWRVRRPRLDQWTAGLLALAALAAIAVAAVGRGLHGRPDVSVGQLVELVLVLAFVLLALIWVLMRRAGFLSYLVIAVAALWEGLELAPTLVNGFVLIAMPAFVARGAAVVGLGVPVALLLMVFRLSDREQAARPPDQELERQGDGAWELA